MTEQLYKEAVKIVANHGSVSTRLLQNKLLVGYNRAEALIMRMRQEKLINANNMYQCW